MSDFTCEHYDGRVREREPLQPRQEPPAVTGPRRVLFILAGLFFVGVAGAGVFLPILPTTPFVLLASFFFIRSSPSLNGWLLRNRMFGPLLRDWHQRRGVRRWVKVVTICLLVSVLGTSLVLMRESWPLMVGLGTVGLIGLVVVLRLPVIEKHHGDADSTDDAGRTDQASRTQLPHGA